MLLGQFIDHVKVFRDVVWGVDGDGDNRDMMANGEHVGGLALPQPLH
jgi:hypothetical protein